MQLSLPVFSPTLLQRITAMTIAAPASAAVPAPTFVSIQVSIFLSIPHPDLSLAMSIATIHITNTILLILN